jgi:hypothetical protein
MLISGNITNGHLLFNKASLHSALESLVDRVHHAGSSTRTTLSAPGHQIGRTLGVDDGAPGARGIWDRRATTSTSLRPNSSTKANAAPQLRGSHVILPGGHDGARLSLQNDLKPKAGSRARLSAVAGESGARLA